jgi:predicted transcriptional regulator
MRDKEILGLWEAYNQVHTHQEEVEQIDETRRDPRGRPASGPMSVYGGTGKPSPDPEGDDNVSRMDRAQRRVKRTQPRAKGMAADALNTKYSARQTGRGGENPSPSDRTAAGYPHSPRRGGRRGLGAETDRGSGNAAKRRMSEDFDLFDIILEHLVAEGYADTNESALAIMANMSEEWRESIVEELEQLDEISLKTKMKAFAATQDPEADYQYGSKVHAQGDRIRKAIVKKHGEKAGEHADAHADSEHWGRTDKRTGKRQGYAKPRIEKNRTYRTTKKGTMHGQDQAKLKSDLIKRRNQG